MKKLLTTLAIGGLATAFAFSFAACSQGGGNWYLPGSGLAPESPDNANGGDNFVYDKIVEQDFKNVADEPSSYFSLDRNTASYSHVRSQINYGLKVSPYSVRIEELINYFDYDFETPTDTAVGVSTYLADCPWNEEHKLMLAGIKTVEKKTDSVNGNYVFLIDVSGSMGWDDSRLGLAKKGLNMLVDNLGEGDKISVVTYASGVKTVLDGVQCTEQGKQTIKSKVNKLKAGGGTYGSKGLQTAYNIAEKNYIAEGNNRVIIISDGDFNVGISNKDTLIEFISSRTVAEKSVYLSVFGVGMGNMRDDLLESMARHGNGNYAYLDNETEAEKAFCHDLSGTLITVAKDAKAGVTFEDNVVKYRLIGYDNKLLSQEEYEDDTTDAGEIGSNLCVAALYEIELDENAEGSIATVEVKYKDVTGEGEVDTAVSAQVTTSTPSSDDLKFISCVAEFGLVLRQSRYAQNANLYSVLARLNGLAQYVSTDLYRSEFVTLVGKASEIYGKTVNNEKY